MKDVREGKRTHENPNPALESKHGDSPPHKSPGGVLESKLYRKDSVVGVKLKRKMCVTESATSKCSEEIPPSGDFLIKKLKSTSESLTKCLSGVAVLTELSDPLPSGTIGQGKSTEAQVPRKRTETISLKDLLSDVIELEETPSGVIIPKGNPEKAKFIPNKKSSDIISFKELISDVVNLEETPYGVVIPKEKLKLHSASLDATPSPERVTPLKKRNTFTVEQKIGMLNELDSGGKLTDVAKKYDIAVSTMSTIYKDRHRLRCAEYMLGKERKRIRMGQYQNVDEAVLRWYWSKIREGNKPNGPQIQEKAREIAQKFGEQHFEGSAGWLKCFKDRYGIAKCRKFDSQHSSPEDLIEVGLARANVCIRNQMTRRPGKEKDDDGFEVIPNRNSALTQDLKNKGGGLRRVDAVGDLVEVRYIARVLDDAVLHGEVIDSNEKDDHPLCLKVKDWWKSWKEEESSMDMVDGEDRRWWEGALWGATVGTRRMIVLPPDVVSRMKGLKVKLSPEACLVYEVEVLHIRRGVGNEEIKLGQTAGESCKPGKSIIVNARGGGPSEQEGTPRKGHMAGCSLSTAVTSTPSGSPPIQSNMKDTRTPADKASILSRMARMGQPTLILPDLQARRRAASEGDDGTGKISVRGDERTAGNEEDTHADEEVELEDAGYILPMEVEPMPISSGSRPPPPRLQPRPIGVPQVQQPYQSSVYWHSPPQYSNVPSASSYSLPSRPESTLLGHPQQHQQYPYPSHTLALTGPAAMQNPPAFQDPHLSVFLSETRTQNAELRMAMGRLTDKVDAIMGKLDRSPQQQQPQEQNTGELRTAFEKERADWKEKEEKFEKELAEAKSKLTSRVVAVEDRCKLLERENTTLKKELEDMSSKLTTVQNNRTTEISEAVKSAMNSVYSHLQPEFSNGVAYEGLVVRKTLAATIREVTLKFLSSNTEEKDESDQHKGGTSKEVHTMRKKTNKPEIKAKPDGRKVLLRKGSSPKIDVEVSSSAAHHLDSEKSVGNGSSSYKESSKHADEEGPHLEAKSSVRDSSQPRVKEEPRSRISSREGSLEWVINPEPPSPPIFDAGELSESGEEWFP